MHVGTRENLLRATFESIKTGQATVGVVGLGYVGLPTLHLACASGFEGVGFDVDEDKVTSLQDGVSYIDDVPSETLSPGIRYATKTSGDFGVDVWVIAVPTPLVDGHADLTAVRAAAMSVGRALSPGNLVCLESTTYPGTTREIVKPILEEVSGLDAGIDFMLAYSPERIDPGLGVSPAGIPKLVAGLTPDCTKAARRFYVRFIDKVIVMSGLEEAEMAKLLENTYRQVNIALVNQLQTVATDLGVDLLEAIRGAATKPFGFQAFYPGPGVGGHCIGIDAMFLADRVRQKNGTSLSIIEAANEVNRRMPRYVVDRLAELLNDHTQSIRKAKVLVLGLAYKPGVADCRESPSIEVLELLRRKGANVSYHDPFVPTYKNLESQPLTRELVKSQHAVLLLTDHPGVDYTMVVRHGHVVLDTRGILPHKGAVERL